MKKLYNQIMLLVSIFLTTLICSYHDWLIKQYPEWCFVVILGLSCSALFCYILAVMQDLTQSKRTE